MDPRAGLDRCGKSRPHQDSIPDRPARSQSLYRLSYPAHIKELVHFLNTGNAIFIYNANNAENSNTVVCFLLGNSLVSEFHMPTFRNTLSVPSS